MVLILTQGLKLSDTVPDLQRVALGSVKKKIATSFFLKYDYHVRVHEFA